MRAGLEAWRTIKNAESFDSWTAVGEALLVGRVYALRITQAAAPMGQHYCRALSDWLEVHGFDGMSPSVRSVAIELAENIEAIKTWRETLTEKERRRLVHPLSNVRRWRASQSDEARQRDSFVRARVAVSTLVRCMKNCDPEQRDQIIEIVRKRLCL